MNSLKISLCSFLIFLLFVSSGFAQEFYEIREYKIKSSAKKPLTIQFLKDALIPALERQGITRIGAFDALKDDSNNSVYLLIPFKSLTQFSEMNDKLEADKIYQSSGETYFSISKKDPAYERINSSFLKAFRGMPTLETPVGTRGERIFELRTYESHQTEKAKLKVEMFNEGEIDIMKDVELGPIFFGEMLIGENVPNLTYMLSAKNKTDHDAHWEGFKKHPKWLEMKVMPRYKGTVSKITNWYLKALPFSKI